jgi:hypothetical protein
MSVALIIQHEKHKHHIIQYYDYYYYLWPVWFHYIFPHYLINGRILGKKLLNKKCVFRFSLQLFSETFLILRRTKHNIITNAHWSSPQRTRYSCQISMKLGFFFDRFKKKIVKHHDKTQSCVSHWCNHTYELNILYGLQMKSQESQPFSFNKTVHTHMLQFPQLMLRLDRSYFGKDLTNQMSCSL